MVLLRSVLVTGASSGIGEATAVHLARRGFRVFAGARRTEKLASLKGLADGRITPISLDVTNETSINSALEAIADESGTLFGLVNNAGISIMGPIEQLSLEDWRRQFETNVFGLVSMARAVMPQMRAAKQGRIINIGSVTGRIAGPFQGCYAASKHAVEGLSDSMRRELAPHGVKVSVIRPGFINTPFGQQEQEGLERFLGAEQPYDEQIRRFKAWHAKGHPTAPPPTIVAEVVEKALTAARPDAYYTAPQKMYAAIALRNLAPSGIADRLYERLTGLDAFRK